MFKLAICTVLLVALVGAAYAQEPSDCPMFKCSTEENEVCGLDKVTYRNRCYMLSRNCGEDNLLYTGPCRPQAECDIRVKCSLVSDPVCGTDGNTYRNSCLMLSQRCREVEVDYTGECHK